MNKMNVPERFKDHPAFTEIHRGMNFGFLAKRGYYSRKDILAHPKSMAETGVNWVSLYAGVAQETYHSTRIFQDFEFSPSDSELLNLIDKFHEHGIRVYLKPCLFPLDGQWMGSVTFPNHGGNIIEGRSRNYWKEWFDSFNDCTLHYADLAEKSGCESLCVGAEYYGTEGRNEWRDIIASARSVYSGPVTYEFTPSSRKNYSLEWFEDLDFLSYSYYPPAGESPDVLASGWHPGINESDIPKITLEQMIEHLSSRKEKIRSVSERFGNKPIALTEIGCRSALGCSRAPCNFRWETSYDGQEQADYMEAVFKTFEGEPHWMGLYWWKWDETQNRPHYHTDPAGDKGFTIQGKPAAEVLKRHFSK